MTVKTEEVKGVHDWDSLEMEYMETPTTSMNAFARLHNIPYATMHDHAHPPGVPSWEENRERLYADIRRKNAERIADILSENSRNDVASFIALEDRVKRLALASLELIVAPEDAPIEAQEAAHRRLAEMNATQLSGIVNQSLRTLTETGRHRRLLTGQATALFGRADAPDILIDEPIDDARELEMRSRMAQIALRASINGEPIDAEYQVIPPAESPPRTISPNRRISPIPPDSPSLGGL